MDVDSDSDISINLDHAPKSKGKSKGKSNADKKKADKGKAKAKEVGLVARRAALFSDPFYSNRMHGRPLLLAPGTLFKKMKAGVCRRLLKT